MSTEIQKLLRVYVDPEMEQWLEESTKIDQLNLQFHVELNEDTRELSTLSFDGRTFKELGSSSIYGHREITLGNFLNNNIKDFCLSETQIDLEENFDIKIQSKILKSEDHLKLDVLPKTTGKFLNSVDFKTFAAYLVKYINRDDSHNFTIPRSFTYILNVKRNTDLAFRRSYYFQGKFNANSIPEYIKRVFDPTVANNPRYPGKYRHGSDRYSGDLKGKIYELLKPEMIFAIEYLWGHKVNVTADLDKVVEDLDKMPRQDFGLMEVDKVQNLLKSFSGRVDIKEIHDRLKKVGVEPATDLKRWNKKLEAIRTITDISKDLPF